VPKAWEYAQATVYTAISKQDSTLVSIVGKGEKIVGNVDKRASEKERKEDRRRQSR